MPTRFLQFSDHLPIVEFCYARELMGLLDYGRWENFSNVINKAKFANNVSLKEAAIELDFLDEQTCDQLLNPENMLTQAGHTPD